MEQIVNYLQMIVEKMNYSIVKEILLVFTGGFLGFIGSFIIYKKNEKKERENILSEIIIDTEALTEEIRHTVFALKANNYLKEYYLLETHFRIRLGNYNGENNGFFAKIFETFESRVKEWEILSSKLSRIISRHNLYFKRNSTIDENFDSFKNYDIKGSYFTDVESLEDLKKKDISNFENNIKKEMITEFEPVLYKLMNSIVYSIRQELK